MPVSVEEILQDYHRAKREVEKERKIEEWTEAMEEEFKIAKDWLEIVCEEDIDEYRIERETERDLRIKQAKKDIANSVIL